MNSAKLFDRAIFLAKKSANPSPNPRVGAVVFRDGKIIGEGFHERAGLPHAEIIALQKAGKRAENSTLIVTLEPCNHVGRTPPCTHTILKSGVKKVAVGMPDPNPCAAGGAKFLKNRGVEVEFADAKILRACRDLNQIWLKNLRTKMPFVTFKFAVDEFGNSIPPKNKKWLTGEAARRRVQKMRRNFDAVAVGVGTIVADDPRLTIRGIQIQKQPTRIVFDPNGRTPKSAKIFQKPGETRILTRAEFPQFSLPQILRKLFQEGVCSIFLEGGETTAAKFLAAGLVDRAEIFVAKKKILPPICGQKLPLKFCEKIGADFLFSGNLNFYE